MNQLSVYDRDKYDCSVFEEILNPCFIDIQGQRILKVTCFGRRKRIRLTHSLAQLASVCDFDFHWDKETNTTTFTLYTYDSVLKRHVDGKKAIKYLKSIGQENIKLKDELFLSDVLAGYLNYNQKIS